MACAVIVVISEDSEVGIHGVAHQQFLNPTPTFFLSLLLHLRSQDRIHVLFRTLAGLAGIC